MRVHMDNNLMHITHDNNQNNMTTIVVVMVTIITITITTRINAAKIAAAVDMGDV